MPRASHGVYAIGRQGLDSLLGEIGRVRYNKDEVSYVFYKQIALSVAGYAAVIIILGGVVAWFAHDMNRRVVIIHEMRRQTLVRSSSSEQGAMLKIQAGQAASATPFLQSLLPEIDRLIDFPKESSVLARRHGLEFGFLFGASTPGARDAPGTLAFSLSGKGAAGKWLDFLREFEIGRYLIGLDFLRMTSVDGKIYETAINGKIFTQ